MSKQTKNKNQQSETSLAIYILCGAVASLIAVVVYFTGHQFSTILGYFVLLALTSLLYNYKVCIFTASISILGYGLVTAHLFRQGLAYPDPLETLMLSIYFLGASAITSWLVFKIQKKFAFSSAFASKDKTKGILNSLIDGIILLDKKNQIIFLNQQAEKILGVKEDKVMTATISSLAHPSYKNLHEILRAGKDLEHFSTAEIKVQKPQKMILQVTNAPIKEKEKILGTVKIIRDITREKEVDQIKSELISIVSHQLRTPLSAVKWSIKMLLDGDIGKMTGEQKNILAKGYRANERMIHLVNDLLNISRIEEGRFQYKFVSASLEDLIARTINEFSYSLEEKNTTLIFQKPPKPLPKIKMDPSKIHVVLQNIINNATIYTPSGGRIKISLKAKKSQLIVSIEDTGMGIPKRQQSRLFTKFFRADNAIRMQTEGSGLGLFIAKNIIEKHQGQIWAESKKNKGSTFHFSLPLA